MTLGTNARMHARAHTCTRAHRCANAHAHTHAPLYTFAHDASSSPAPLPSHCQQVSFFFGMMRNRLEVTPQTQHRKVICGQSPVAHDFMACSLATCGLAACRLAVCSLVACLCPRRLGLCGPWPPDPWPRGIAAVRHCSLLVVLWACLWPSSMWSAAYGLSMPCIACTTFDRRTPCAYQPVYGLQPAYAL